MKRLSFACAISLGAVAAPASADPTPAASLLGTWTLDTASMPIPAGMRPASVTAEFAEVAPGTWNTTYVITAADGTTRRMTSRERLDGVAVPIEGDTMEADSVAVTAPAPGVLVMNLAKDGRPGSVRVYAVSTDGKEMTENAASVGADGKPLVRTFRWARR